MALPGLFPIYPTGPISTGPFHVSLTIPGPISEISKSVGITASCMLLVPNIQYLIKFVDGDLGIADQIMKNMMLKNINKCKTEESFKHFAKLVKLDIPDPSKYKTKNGYSIPKTLVEVDPSNDLMGIKAMEKTILTSIFETQKPYIEIAKLVVDNLAKIEDIIARFMPILAPAPDITTRLAILSEKPKTNNGVKNGRPTAIGYKGGQDLKPSLGKLQSLSKKGKEVKIDINGNPTTTPPRSNSSTDPTPNQPESNSSDAPSGQYRIISTVYSTGQFDPNVKYNYIYKDIKDEPTELSDKSDLNLEDDDPYKKLKPKRVIFGIFNSQGEIINPMTKLKTLDGQGNEIDTPFHVADWITRSPKWYFPNNINNQSSQYNWPRFGSPFYYWERYGGSEVRRDQGKPDPGNGPDFTRKTYDDGFRKGEYIVDFTGTSERSEFLAYFTDLVSKKINASNGLDPGEKQHYIDEVISKLHVKDEEGSKQVGPFTLEKTQIDNHLDSAFKYGILNGSTFVNPNNQQPMDIPSGMKYPLKPSSLKIAGNDVWMDPESDYDLKVIKVDSVLDIRYEDSQGKPEVETKILAFIKNTLSINVDDNTTKLPFSISIAKNQSAPSTYENITEYQLDNWNYDDDDGLLGNNKPKINNNNTYTIQVWRYIENPYYKNTTNTSAPLQGNTYFELERLVADVSNWSYKEFKVESPTPTTIPAITSGGTTAEYDIQDVTVRRVKIQKLLNETDNKIIQWYYGSGKGNLKWYSVPPTTWKNPIDWSVESNPSYTPNGSFPPTKTVDTKTFHISSITSSGTASWIFSDIKSTKEIRRYISVDNGIKTLPDGSVVEVIDYKIKRWIVWDTSINVGSTLNGKTVLPAFQRDNNISLLYQTFGNNATLDASFTVTNVPPFQIRVKDTSKYGKMIDPSKLTNNHLTNPELYSSSRYGGSPQEVGLVKRYMKTELDTETYYILEGVLVEANPQNSTNGGNGSNTNPNNQSGGGTEWYTMPSALGAIKVFLSMLADIFSKLVPAINKLLTLFSNPAKFITDIITEKLGESFLIFSPEAMEVMRKMPTIKIPDREKFIKSSILNNYISVNPDGTYRFLLDGSGLMKLPILGNTITFGMQLAMLQPLIKLIFSIDFNEVPNNTLNSFLNKEEKSKSPLSNLGNVDLRADQNNVKNTIVTESNGRQNTEEVSIQYSTGKFIEGVDYQYVYLTEYVANLVKEADELEQTNDPDNLELAKAKLELALKADPKNPLIQSKFDDLFKKTNNYIQPILKFLIEIVSLPVKIIAKIIEQILAFFKGGEFADDKNFPGLVSLPSLPTNMAKFLSFQWVIGLFKPMNLLKMAGINFDVPKLLDWVSNLDSFPKDFEFDLSEVIDIALIAKMPKVKKDQFIDMLKKPFRILYSILCLLEALINAIIDFIWATLGIEAIIPPPHIKLCKQLNEGEMSTEDIMDLLNGLMKDSGASAASGGNGDAGTSGGTGKGDYNFIYDIKLSDGRSIRDLNEEDLRSFIEDNKDISFDFLFD